MPFDGSSLEMLSPHLGRSENISRSQIGEPARGEVEMMLRLAQNEDFRESGLRESSNQTMEPTADRPYVSDGPGGDA
jgi:hypothetical protein